MPIFLNKNMGTTYSRNLALRKAKGNFIVILDSDVEVPLATIPQLLKVLKERRDIGLVTPKLIYPDGRLQKSTDKFPTLPSKMIRYLFLKQIEKKESRSQTKNYPVEPDYAISALWVFRREVLDNVGLLDERIFYAPEDVDYCLRVWKKGYKVHYDPACFAIHHTQDHIKGLVYYFRKHKYLFRRPKRPIITFSSCR
jgi:GT2 family glycosyltransferase